MPLPNITSGKAKSCRARTKSRNLAPCLNLAAYGTPVCSKHGAVHPDKRQKGKSHWNYKYGQDTKDAVQTRQMLNTKLRNMEDALFILGAIEGKQHTRGNLPLGYKKLNTLKDVENFILAVEASE
jgi:hypothetical protein